MLSMAEPSGDVALIVVAVVAAVPGTIAAISGRRAAREAKSANVQAKAANAAVNNREPSEPGIYELAREAAANSRDAARRCSELEGGQQQLAREIGEVRQIAQRAGGVADANRESIGDLVAEQRQLIEEHRRQWAEDAAARNGRLERRRRWWR